MTAERELVYNILVSMISSVLGNDLCEAVLDGYWDEIRDQNWDGNNMEYVP